MKHYFDTNGKEIEQVPDPFHGASPMYKSDGTLDEAKFRALGGTITDDGEPDPKEKFAAAFDAYLAELKAKADDLALNITVEEFKEAAGSMMSAELVAWAKSKGVPDRMIDEERPRVLALIADASRLGMTWADIFPKQPSN